VKKSLHSSQSVNRYPYKKAGLDGSLLFLIIRFASTSNSHILHSKSSPWRGIGLIPDVRHLQTSLLLFAERGIRSESPDQRLVVDCSKRHSTLVGRPSFQPAEKSKQNQTVDTQTEVLTNSPRRFRAVQISAWGTCHPTFKVNLLSSPWFWGPGTWASGMIDCFLCYGMAMVGYERRKGDQAQIAAHLQLQDK
jgi:hypothetical protein